MDGTPTIVEKQGGDAKNVIPIGLPLLRPTLLMNRSATNQAGKLG